MSSEKHFNNEFQIIDWSFNNSWWLDIPKASGKTLPFNEENYSNIEFSSAIFFFEWSSTIKKQIWAEP